MKALAIKAQLLIFRRCYCASPDTGVMDDLSDLRELSFAVPRKAWAERTARKRSAKTGQDWYVRKWSQR